MYLTAKRALPFLTVCIVCCSLLTFDYFGITSLSAYFGFSITALTVSIITSFLFLKNRKKIQFSFKSLQPWLPAGLFGLLALYALFHGFVKDNFNLSHYYWLTAAVLLLTVQSIITPDRSIYLHTGIISLAIFESIVVIFQRIEIIPSLNDLFACTGTWVNPNVTALFLALSLFSQKRLINKRIGKFIFIFQLALILLAIILLQCRTAYIVAVILLLAFYKPSIPAYKLTIAKIAAIALFICLLAFVFKTHSTDGRLQIWQNCLHLIFTNPIAGTGFGQFEKEYNSFVAAHNLSSADHVFMPYNDFLELAIEGGAIAVVLWVAFLVLLIRRFKNDSHVLSMIIGFIVIQLTNFGFQAIPVFALFTIYTGCILHHHKKSQDDSATPVWPAFRPVILMAIIVQLYCFTKLVSIATAFHQVKFIRKAYPPSLATERYAALSPTLNFSSVYHENYADMFMQSGNYQSAILQYRQALETTSRPDVLGKCGWCYGQLGKYDSAAAYFKAIEQLQPYKYAPRMALLKLFELKKDTVSIRLKAREIMAMPVKVPGTQVANIKSEASKWVKR